MKNSRKIIQNSLAFAASLFGLFIGNASAEERQNAAPIVEFELASEVLAQSEIQLANGIVVRAADWPALIIARFSNQNGGGRISSCTASLIGPNVVLTAAHCVDPQVENGKPLLASLRIGNRTLKMNCDMHPDYSKEPLMGLSPRSSEDFALCILDDGGERPQQLKTMKYEVVDDDGVLVHGSKVVMTGYGCKDLRVVNGMPKAGQWDGYLRIGDGVIDKPAGSSPGRASYVTIKSVAGVEPALCPGDSGGPLLSGITAQDTDNVRRIRGVNSSIAAVEGVFISRISATGTDAFRSWAQDWLSRNERFKPEACGINFEAGERQCRF
ncbi:S1 family peptidase [Metapseudomonas lalkuanensis]|uniref:S1 family peptidase n=1 Tax=Metapseudomonas lalkuanensis TaxID=2604832 RepID=A0A5J6QNJ2_9GAMM|nr:trypsin-like serine protease [Pseudomonas lalkuanensis]QEY63365.1 S1 family peptidase [Pseudomonas lalkuanensis]